MIEYIILGLVYAKARSGYEIKKIIEESISMFYKASNGSIYPALRKLENKGWVKMTKDGDGPREKKIYEVTTMGKEVFIQWLEEPIQYTTSGAQECVKVFFYDFLDVSKRKQLLVKLEESIKETLHEFEVFREQCIHAGYKDKCYYRMSTLFYGMGICKETLRWCELIKEQKILEY